VLPKAHLLARLYMLESHEKNHRGRDCMVMRSQNKVWIMASQKLAKKVQGHCFTCRYVAKGF
jgi:hypothetical protein